MSHTRRRFLVSAMLAGVPIILISPAAVRAQGMSQMPGMGDAKQETTASVIGTITAINAADRRVTFNHSAKPQIKWPAMKMEFPVVPSVDLSKVKVGDKVRFTLSGSKNSYTVQSISPTP
jgi:Cu(I)/Ag(I) efflux system protein CusF